MDSHDLVDKAIDAFKKGDTGDCERLCRQILAQDRNHTQGLHILGLVAGRKGDFAAEVKLIRRAITGSPGNAELHNNLGTALHKQGRLRKAIAAHHRAIELNPRFQEAYNNLGSALNDADQLMEAEQAFERAIELAPENIDYKNNLAVCLHSQGCTEKAAACLQKTITSSANANLYYTYGLLLTRLGDNKAAIEAQLKAIELEPRNTRAWLQLVLRNSYTSLDHPHVKALQQILAGKGFTEEDHMLTHFALGKCYEDCGRHETAFRHYRDANRLMAAKHIYPTANREKRGKAIIATFTRKFILDNQLADSSSSQPLFIVGMSRTGKTNLEKMLSIHPDIYRGGELYAFPARTVKHLAIQTGGFPEPFASRVTPGLLQEAAMRYRRFTSRISADSRFITDTLNRNTSYLGVIAMLFPNARIIRMRRDPLDTLVSIYFKWFGAGGHYSYRLDDIRAIMAQNDALMEHWKQTLPITVLELSYEDLVSNPAETASLAAEYCGLSVSPALQKAWSGTGLDERWIGRGRHYRKYLEKELPGLSNFR